MSQFESKLAAFTITITESPCVDDTLQSLDELCDRIFALTSGTSSNLSSGTAPYRYAVILYPIVQMGSPEFTPVKAILHENRPDQPQRVVVDIQTGTVEDEDHGVNIPIEPEEIERALEGIKIYIRNYWESNGVKKPTDWRDFLQCLETSGVLPGGPYPDPHPTSIHKQCPLCETWTSRCTLCYAIMCSNRECVVSQVIPFQSCSRHPSKAMCLPCLETGKIEWRLGQCPECELWFWFSELMWCIGRTTDFSGSLPDSREHPVKPVGCSSCVGTRDRCASATCWSNTIGLNTGVCKSCSPEGGLWCMCQRSWICDTCRISPTNKLLVECRGCRKVYCLEECNYIGYCSECGRTSVCDDCFEEDGDLGLDVDEVVPKTKCEIPDCMQRLCAECLDAAQCVDCYDSTCGYCSLQASGDLGNGRLCSPCYYKRFEAAVERQFTF